MMLGRMLILVAGLFAPIAASAQDLTAFDGRTITFMVGSDPGGGYDTTARLVAEHLEKTLSGSSVVISNEGRMGGLVALNRLSATTRSTPVIMMFNTGFLLSQLLEDPLLRADFGQLDYIGKVTSEARYIVVAASTGITDWEGLAAHEGELLMPSQSPNSAGYVQARLFGDAFGIDINPLPGFSGSEGRAAIAKGELQLDLTSENNVERLIKGGAAAAVLRFGPAMLEEFAGVRDAASVVETDEQRDVVRTIAGLTMLGRIIVASPGMTDEDLATIRLAFDTAMNDPEFRAAAVEQGLAVDPLGGEETKILILEVISTEGPIQALLRNIQD